MNYYYFSKREIDIILTKISADKYETLHGHDQALLFKNKVKDFLDRLRFINIIFDNDIQQLGYLLLLFKLG